MAQKRSVEIDDEQIAVVAEADFADSPQDLGLNLALHVVDVFARADEPVEWFEMFQIGQFGVVASGRIRLGPLIFVKAAARLARQGDHVANHPFSPRVAHIQQILLFQLRTVGEQLFHPVQPSREVVAAPVVESNRPERLAHHRPHFLRAEFILELLDQARGDRMRLLDSIAQHLAHPRLDLRAHVLNIIQGGLRLGPRFFPAFLEIALAKPSHFLLLVAAEQRDPIHAQRQRHNADHQQEIAKGGLR
ncbi:MAG: hypothetical protein BWZ10_02085 [candidate division BRC1 bacterium ADurb.BinA364]|nr:MAG: hypothetical protein BWZ10_02085 [candidate division BRC1 bacterium ADurb.BinA364]